MVETSFSSVCRDRVPYTELPERYPRRGTRVIPEEVLCTRQRSVHTTLPESSMGPWKTPRDSGLGLVGFVGCGVGTRSPTDRLFTRYHVDCPVGGRGRGRRSPYLDSSVGEGRGLPHPLGVHGLPTDPGLLIRLSLRYGMNYKCIPLVFFL